MQTCGNGQRDEERLDDGWACDQKGQAMMLEKVKMRVIGSTQKDMG